MYQAQLALHAALMETTYTRITALPHSQLPPSFKNLSNLVEFTAEGCPMRIPTQNVIIRGPDAVRKWCAHSREGTVFRSRQRTWLLEHVALNS